jgi:3-oxoacyl-[acyl-carrier protein] reductase
MDLGLQDKVAIIAGGSRGIGKAVALTPAAEGCHVALAARVVDGRQVPCYAPAGSS